MTLRTWISHASHDSMLSPTTTRAAMEPDEAFAAEARVLMGWVSVHCFVEEL
jgi:hypothetical protein